MTTTLSRQLVDLIRQKTVSVADRQHASLFVLDALACAYAGSATSVGQTLIQWARKQPLNTRTTAFLAGALTHITETDDLHRASVTHPGCIVVPAVLTQAMQREYAGSGLLDATLQGFEVMCRVGNAVGPEHYKVWHNTATCGPFGAAMAVGALLELSDTQIVNALGNAGTQSSGLWQFLNTGAMSKHLHAGRASESGLLSAELAHSDFTGSPDILEGAQGFFQGLCPDPDISQVLCNPNAPWQLVQTSIKPWPCCRHTHPAIDAALSIQTQLGNRVVEHAEVTTYRAALDICDRVAPDNDYQARFSLQHCVAAALSDGEVTLQSFDEGARTRHASQAQRVTVNCDNPYRDAYPGAWGASVRVITTEGDTLEELRTDCKGDPELPLTNDEMTAKAVMLMEYGGLEHGAAQAVCQQVLSLPSSQQAPPLMQHFMAHCLK